MLSASSFVYRLSVQINLQPVFKMSPPPPNACVQIGTSLAYTPDVQRYRHGVLLFCTRLFDRAEGENERCLLSRRAADVEVIL